MNVFCPDCSHIEPFDIARWRCECGGAWEPQEEQDFDPALIDSAEYSIWRYRRYYPAGLRDPAIKLGAGWTPLLKRPFDGRRVLFKAEFIAPTGSFKDRGMAAIVNYLKQAGATRLAEDSSGNAGASLAAYAAAANLHADIFVPAYASAAKQAQIAVYGATVRPISGPRVNAKLACFQAVEAGATMAAHAYHPAFLVGQQSIAFELWEQLGGRAPDWYVAPVGQGLHLLGVWLGFRRLQAAGLVTHVPRMVAVQAARLAPLCEAWAGGLDTVPGVQVGQPTVAEGLAIAEPVRGRRLLQALRESGGRCVAVEEEAILAALQRLAHRGLWIEPTSATAVAALPAVLAAAEPAETVVVALTGSGLKGAPAHSD